MVRLTVTKLYIILCFILFFSFSCDRNSEKDTVQEGIEEWKKKEFTIERYYTLADTFTTVSDYSPVVVRHAENSLVEVTWYVNNNPIPHIEIEKEKLQESGIWQSIYKPVWKDYELKMGDIVKAEVILNQDYTEQTAVIYEKTIQSDIFGVNFGMSPQQVKEAETRRAEIDGEQTDEILWKETESYSLLWYSSNFSQGVTIYYFLDEKLVKVGEFTYILENTSGEISVNQKVVNLCYRYGLQKNIQFDKNKIPLKDEDGDYIWNNGQLQFSFEYLAEIPTSKNGEDTSPGLGIVYTKL